MQLVSPHVIKNELNEIYNDDTIKIGFAISFIYFFFIVVVVVVISNKCLNEEFVLIIWVEH